MNYIIGNENVVIDYLDKLEFCYGTKTEVLRVAKILTHSFKDDIVFIDATLDGVNLSRSVKYILKSNSRVIIINGAHAGCSSLSFPAMQDELMNLKMGKSNEWGDKKVIGESIHTKNLAMRLDIIGNTNSTVLILGESGVGKEVAANTIHRNSTRKLMPFIAINCGAIPDNLLESELFGYKKGSFTGAYADKVGKIEQANGGTLFLDEIGEMPLVMQTKLLRVLQERTVQRIGGNSEISVDIRIISATNANLHEKVANGDFREDLYYRLNVIPVEIMPLRERKEDILPLVVHFSEDRILGGISLDDDAAKVLTGYGWPGNVREVVNFVERAAAFFQHSKISMIDAQNLISGSSNSLTINHDNTIGESIPIRKIKKPLKESVLEFEKKLIVDALKSCDGNIKDAGVVIGVKRTTLLEKMKRMNIS